MKYTDEHVKDLALDFAQLGVNHDKALVAEKRWLVAKKEVAITWSGILQKIKYLRKEGYEAEEGDQERILSELRKMDRETMFLKEQVYKAFSFLYVTGKLADVEAPPETPRTSVLQTALEQVQSGKKKGKIRTNKEVQLMVEVDTDLAKGDEETADLRLANRMEEWCNEAGRIAWDYRDRTTLEKIFAYGVDDFLPRWHAQFDPMIEKDKKQRAAKAKKANGGK